MIDIEDGGTISCRSYIGILEPYEPYSFRYAADAKLLVIRLLLDAISNSASSMIIIQYADHKI